MAIKRTETVDALSVRDSADFGGNKLTSVAAGTVNTDAVNVQQLNDAAFAGGWDSVVWDETSGDLKFYIGGTLDYTVNIDDRYLTSAEVQALIDASSKNVYAMRLEYGTSVQGRIDNSSGSLLPSGWTLSASGLDLIINHNLGRRVMDVKIWAVTLLLDEEQQLRNTASDNGLVTISDNTLKIVSLSTVPKPIKIYISFV
jgi:hypothetical protein